MVNWLHLICKGVLTLLLVFPVTQAVRVWKTPGKSVTWENDVLEAFKMNSDILPNGASELIENGRSLKVLYHGDLHGENGAIQRAVIVVLMEKPIEQTEFGRRVVRDPVSTLLTPPSSSSSEPPNPDISNVDSGKGAENGTGKEKENPKKSLSIHDCNVYNDPNLLMTVFVSVFYWENSNTKKFTFVGSSPLLKSPARNAVDEVIGLVAENRDKEPDGTKKFSETFEGVPFRQFVGKTAGEIAKIIEDEGLSGIVRVGVTETPLLIAKGGDNQYLVVYQLNEALKNFEKEAAELLSYRATATKYGTEGKKLCTLRSRYFKSTLKTDIPAYCKKFDNLLNYPMTTTGVPDISDGVAGPDVYHAPPDTVVTGA